MPLELNRNARRQRRDKPWLVSGGIALSYGEQAQRCAALRRWCEDAGLGLGAPVLLAVADDLEQASLLAGLICIGRVPLILDPEAMPAEILRVLADSRFAGVIGEPRLLERWQLAGWAGPCLRVAPLRPQGGLFERLLGRKRAAVQEDSWPALAGAAPESSLEDPPPTGLAYVIFTSGTTSRPKGVEIGQRALQSQMAVLLSQFGLDEGCRLLNVLPLHHADGLVQGPLLAWVAGGTVWRPGPFSAASLPALMDAIYRERITHLIAVPTMLALMLRLGQEQAENFRSPDFRFIVSCAGHLETALWEALEQAFGTRVVNLYGLSETVTSALFSGPDDASRQLGCLGLPVNCTIRILDQEGAPTPEGEVGELWIAGEQLMDAYHNDPAATREVLQDGWLRSGDLVRRRPGGHLELQGRCKNLIISGGRNISPEEVAACLNLHPQVLESVVLGRADPDWGERVAALVVPAGAFSETALVEWCRARLSEYKIPRRILPVTQLEKGPSGKIRVEAARRQLQEGLAAPGGEEARSDLEMSVLALAAQCFRLPAERLAAGSGPHNTPGWDSLAHMEFVVAMERHFALVFSAREIMQIDSLASAVRICRQKDAPSRQAGPQ